MFEKKNILGVGITDASEEQILEYIGSIIKKKQKKLFVATPNPEFLVFAKHHPRFKTILNEADLALADGVGVVWASKILKKPLKGRITGVDLMEKLCEKSVDWTATVGFLGGRGGVAEKTSECLKRLYPNLKISFAVSELSELSNSTLSNVSRIKIHNTYYMIPDTDILFVAFGFPKQEEWIYDNLSNIPVKAAMGVGGAFDYVSGNVPRAPKWVRSLGFEWLFRLFVEPWRIKRQLALVEFLWMAVKEKIQALPE